ncbi:uncharacterized protein LOC143186345 isoform X3 [Calliopsis andreniformis]|uniref:uncharacterized protein LOC143186345 isoform X3 n=1 Tax=Calliopsis andreniformis TaxID=337506 RepID=UPI003FCE627E
MNSLDSTIESIQNISILMDEDRNCTAFDETTGELCGESDSLKIINKFQKLYETRIQNVDQEFENKFDQVCVKLEISKEWIKNLKEQNIMLVQTVEDLEQAACNKVKLLEQKLKHSSMLVSENLTNSNETEKTIHLLSKRVSDLENDEKYMRQRIEFLQSDIRGLLELIRRAAQENRWNLDNIKFCEIRPSDIPIPIDCTCDQEETNKNLMLSLKLQNEQFQEKEKNMIIYQKELENEVANLNRKLEAKEDIIQKYVTQLQSFNDNFKKHTKSADQAICNSFTTNDQESTDEPHRVPNVCADTNTNQENQIILYLTKVKSFMIHEYDVLFKLQVDLEKLCCEKNQELVKNISHINEICSKKEELIATVDFLILKLENNNTLYTDGTNVCLPVLNNQHSKLKDTLIACAHEAQTTTQDIKNEVNIIVSTFKFRHQKYVDLNKEVANVQNQLIRNQERIAETINKMQIQEKEKLRYDERIKSGKIKLKDLKNELNHAQSQLSFHINDMQNNGDENIVSNYTGMCICNDLLHSVLEEVEQISNSLQIFHTQEHCIESNLEELKNELYETDSPITLLQQKIEETLQHDTVEIILHEKEQKLEQLNKKIDMMYLKLQVILESFVHLKDQVPDIGDTESQLCIQTLNEILRTNEDLHGLRKQHEEFKYRMSHKLDDTECDEKYKVTDLQNRIKILQNEAKCNQEANEFLKNNIKSLEQELHVMKVKAENSKRSHSMDILELKKKIIELENTLKLQREIEYTLRQQLSNNEAELKKSKDFLSSYHTEHNMEETLLHCDCNQFKHDTMISEDSSNFCSSVRPIVNLVDELKKYEDELDSCVQEIKKLKNALYSKDKIFENMNTICKIQKDSIAITQAANKELYQKLQEKIDNQDQIISQYEKEKKELLKQNELQIQTIGHLQNAVVEAKKCMDQMKRRTISDLQENSETVRLLTVYMEETQSQYNECFAEAAKQDKVLELQRDVIHDLQQKLHYMEYHNHLTTNSICITHCSILKIIQEQLEIRVNEIQALKCKIESLVQSKCHLESKYLNVKKLLQEKDGKLQELNKETLKSEQKIKIYESRECQCKVEVEDKICTTHDILDFNNAICNDGQPINNFLYEHELQSEVDILTRENEDMKKQLQKYKLDFDIIEKELKIKKENEINIEEISFELQKVKNTEHYLRCENEQLKSDLEKQKQKANNLSEKLQFVKENGVKFEKLFKKLEEKQIQINSLSNQISNNEGVIKKQNETIEELEKKLDVNNKQIKEYLQELDDAEKEISALHCRIQSLKSTLVEKSNDLIKLQADYEVLKNDNSILMAENNEFENKTKEDVCQFKNMLKEVQMQLCFTEDNYHRVTEDFNKTQDQLIKITKREADLQECLTNMEKDYCLKLSNAEKEKAKLRDCLDKLRDEFEKIQEDYLSKDREHCKLQDICKSYTEQLEMLQQQIEKEQDQVKKLEESNNYTIQQLHECMEQNCLLLKEKAMNKKNNNKIMSELQEMHNSFLELRKECQLKSKSLACISAELTETAISRSELCNHSQYVVSCMRIWMEEQRDYINKLNSKFKSQQQQLLQLEREKKVLLDETKKLKRINHLLTQRLKRIHRYGGKNVKNVCVGCHIVPSIATKNTEILIPINSKQPSSQKKLSFSKTSHHISACGNVWWFPKMKYLANELRKSNLKYDNICKPENVDTTMEESCDCGYQSSTSK